jgi:hypothetical protein
MGALKTAPREPRLVGAHITDESGTTVLRHGDIDVGQVNEGPARDRLLLGGGALPRAGYEDLMRLRMAWANAGHDLNDPTVLELVERGVAPMAGGMPVGSSGMAFMHNVPEQGSFVENTQQFFLNTERNDIPQAPSPFPGFGAPVDYRIPNVGVLSAIRVVLKLSLVVGGTGAVTTTYQWPWNIIKRASLNANGQTQIISAEGNDLRARRQRFFRNPRDPISGGPAVDTIYGDPQPGVIANGTYNVVLVYDLPIAHDDYEMAGSLYAQSDQNSLAWRLEAAAQSDLFSIAAGGTVALTGTVYWTTTVYDIPTADTSRGRVVLLPDMSWIHGFLGTNQPHERPAAGHLRLPRQRRRRDHRPARPVGGPFPVRRQPQAPDVQSDRDPRGEERPRLQRAHPAEGRLLPARQRGRQPGARPRAAEGRHRAAGRDRHPDRDLAQRQQSRALRRGDDVQGAHRRLRRPRVRHR